MSNRLARQGWHSRIMPMTGVTSDNSPWSGVGQMLDPGWPGSTTGTRDEALHAESPRAD